MSTSLKLRRGTTTQHTTFTGAEGEITVDTTKKTVVVHDGTTAGGIPLAKESNFSGVVRYDSAQTLTDPNKAQVLANIGAAANPAANGIAVRTAADAMTARAIAAGTGISVTNGDGVAGNPTVTNTGVTKMGVATGDVVIGTGLSMTGNTLNCTVTSPVQSVGGNTGAITNAQLKDSVVAGLGYTPANGASYVPKDGSSAIGAFVHGYLSQNPVVGTSYAGSSIRVINTGTNGDFYASAGTWKCVMQLGATFWDGSYPMGLFQRIA